LTSRTPATALRENKQSSTSFRTSYPGAINTSILLAAIQ
jgi:hypothetical protein